MKHSAPKKLSEFFSLLFGPPFRLITGLRYEDTIFKIGFCYIRLAYQVMRFFIKKRIEGDGYFMGLEYNDDKHTVAVGRKALEGTYNWLSEGAALRDYK